MNRPRNRQPRKGNDRPRSNAADNRPSHGSNRSAAASGTVPTTQQVQPGATVSIILKADQATGREVQGVVQALLTRGNHPRGIKVRLQDGRIGRVQRMVTLGSGLDAAVRNVQSVAAEQSQMRSAPFGGASGSARGYATVAAGSVDQEATPDFSNESVPTSSDLSLASATVKCPICSEFEGDEAAVSHHVQEHLD